jgi:hypothetical protein
MLCRREVLRERDANEILGRFGRQKSQGMNGALIRCGRLSY